jgi:hypothetical protein
VTTKNQGKTRTRRTPDEIVRALLDKTIENGATADEELAAVAASPVGTGAASHDRKFGRSVERECLRSSLPHNYFPVPFRREFRL